MNAVLVTGAAGFLGSHISEFYLKQGYQVIGIDNFSTGSPSNAAFLKNTYPLFTFIEHDVTQPWNFNFSINNLINIFHFASPASPPHYQRLAIETLWVNSIGLNHALEFADRHNAKLVFASTSEVYGDPAVSPQTENYWGNVNSFGERSCYDEAKRFGEALVFSHNKKHSTKHGLVRIFNTYGPRMNPNDGRVVINFIVQALKDEPLTVYGNGLQTRSFCYVDDLVAGIAKYASTTICHPINIGNDTEFNMLELAKLVIEANHSKSEVVFRPLPSDDPKIRRPDLTRALSELHPWKPEIHLREGLKRMSHWVASLNL